MPSRGEESQLNTIVGSEIAVPCGWQKQLHTIVGNDDSVQCERGN